MRQVPCPKCGGYAQARESFSPDYEKIECFGQITYKDRFGKEKQKSCGFEDFVKKTN